MEPFITDFLWVLISESSLYAAQDALVQSDQAVSLNFCSFTKHSAVAGNTPPIRLPRWQAAVKSTRVIHNFALFNGHASQRKFCWSKRN